MHHSSFLTNKIYNNASLTIFNHKTKLLNITDRHNKINKQKKTSILQMVGT